MTDQSAIPALQAALQGEYAAVYGYGVAAGRLRGADLSRARRYLDAHRARRDRLRALLLDQRAVPTPAAPQYVVPASSTAAQARAVLAGIEQRLVAVYADLVAAATDGVRTFAVAATVESSVRSAEWGGAVPAFPGLPERAAQPSPTPMSTPSVR